MKKKSKWLIGFLILAGVVVACSKNETNPAGTDGNSAVQNVTTNNLKSSTISQLSDIQISSVILYGGQTMNAGTVSIYQTDTNGDFVYDAIKVTYNLTGDWTFNSKIHFYIGLGPVPSNNAGNYEPGQFPYVFTPNTNPYSFVIPFSTLGFQGCNPLDFVVAAHAELYSPTLGQQTGFGDGTSTGKNWFTQYSLTLNDKTPPRASDVTLNVECIGDVPVQTPDVITDESDNCALASNPVTFVSEFNDGKFCPTTIVRTYLITDAAGNTATATQTIVVEDKTAPVLSGQGANVLLACSTEVNFTEPKASDNCDIALVTITFTDSQTTNSAGKVTSVTRTWVATDKCGNVSSPVSQTFTLDVNAPVLTLNGPAYQSIVCDASPLFTSPTATDNYDLNPTVIQVGEDAVQILGYFTYYTRTWSATDKCGNSSTISQTIVKDCTPVAPPPGDFPAGSGTGWAYDNALSTPFGLISPKTSNNWGWSNKLSFGSHVYTLYVGAGQSDITKGIPVGTVTVDYNSANIKVSYLVSNLCNLTEAHVWVGKTLLPLKRGTYISSPGQLGNNSGSLSSTTYEFTIPNTFGTIDIFVAAHAVVVLK